MHLVMIDNIQYYYFLKLKKIVKFPPGSTDQCSDKKEFFFFN